MAPIFKSFMATLLPALLATLLTAAMQQFPSEFVGSQHDSLHISLRIADPTLFPHDAFVTSASHQPTILWHVIGWLVPLQGESAIRTMTLGVLFFNFLFFIGIGALVLALGGGSWTAAGAMAVLCGMGDPLVGANYILGNHITASSIVAGPLLFALALAVRGRLLAAYVLIGLCANVHVLQSAYVGALILCGEAARAFFTHNRDWRSLLPLARAVGVGALCALPVLAMIAAGPRGATPDGWADTVLRGHVIHYFLLSQLWLQQLRTAALLILGVGLVWLWSPGHKPNHLSPQSLFLAGILTAWTLGFLFIGGLLSDVVKLPLAIKVQPLRATMWALLIIVPSACVILERLIREKHSPATAWALVGVLGAILVLNVLRPFGGAFNIRLTPFVLLFSFAVLLAPFLKDRLDRYTAILAALALVAPASILFVWLGTVPLLRVLGTAAGYQMLVLLLFVIGLVWWLCGKVPMPRIPTATLGAWLAAGAIVTLVAMDRVQQGQPLLFMPRDELWHQAARFIAEHTPPDALIQGDPRKTGLRTITRRSVFFEQNDDGALYFDPSSLGWLRQRAQLLRVPLIKTYARPIPWPAANVPWEQLASHHGVTHAMVPADTPVEGEIVFQNAQWKVIRL